MFKMIALYKQPQDAAEFDRQYFQEHLPLAMKMPGLKRSEVSKINGSPMGQSEYYLIAEMYFDDMESLKAATSSAEGKAAAKNLMSFAKDIVTMMFAEVEKVPAGIGG
jgi:uncharacterized protein (TIGR02118 family)